MTSRDPTELPFSTVDAHSPVPLYHQIYLDLRQMVKRGLIPPGGLLPPELDICQAYGVGRQTVRQALARLVNEDLVERFAGRGTFVRSQPSQAQSFLDRSFSQQMREMGRTPRSRVLSLQTSTTDPDLTPAFSNYPGIACLTLERLRLGDNEPICHQTSTVRIDLCPGLQEEHFASQSLYEILSSRYQLTIQRMDHVVRAVAADEYRADLLGVPEGAPLLFVGTTAFLENGETIEYSASYYHTDRYEYRTIQICCDK